MAPMPYTMPMRAGLTPSSFSRSDNTGSSIDSVDDTASTATAHSATAGTRSTSPIGTGSRSAGSAGTSNQTNASIAANASSATNTNGSRMPPSSYSHPPIDGPIMKAKLVPIMTMPVTRPRADAG